MDTLEPYVAALFTVYIIIIFVRILLSFVPMGPDAALARAWSELRPPDAPTGTWGSSGG